MKRIVIILFLLLTQLKPGWSQWTLNYQTPHNQIVAVFSSPNDSICWFITNMDSLFKTNNGGQTWIKLPPSNASFYPSGIFVMNNDTAFKSANGELYRTVNGGVSWSLVFSGMSMQSPVVWMKNDLEGVMAYNGQLYKSTNGGTSWSNSGVVQPPGAITNSTGSGTIWMKNDSIWVAIASGGVAFSPDYGSNWSLPANTGLNFSGYGSISFSNAQLGIAVRQNSPFVYVTIDGAQTWTASTNSLGANQDVLAYNSGLWFIPNPADHFYIKHSADLGITWQQELFDADGFEILEKSRDGNTLWAGTGKGKIYINHLPVFTGISNFNGDDGFHITPNLSGNNFKFNSGDNSSNCSLLITDMYGNMVEDIYDVSDGLVFGENYVSGFYIVTVRSNSIPFSRIRILKIK